MNIGDIIKSKRQKKNMTQTELAEKLNVTPQAMSRWEMGISYPDIAMVPLISEVLWVSADELPGIVPSYKKPERSFIVLQQYPYCLTVGFCSGKAYYMCLPAAGFCETILSPTIYA